VREEYGALVAVACALAMGVSVAGQRSKIDFEADTVGSPPKGFSFALTGQGRPGTWVVKKDDAGHGHVLVQSDTDQTDYRFPVAIYNDFSAADVALSVAFKAMAGKGDQGVGQGIIPVPPGQNPGQQGQFGKGKGRGGKRLVFEKGDLESEYCRRLAFACAGQAFQLRLRRPHRSGQRIALLIRRSRGASRARLCIQAKERPLSQPRRRRRTDDPPHRTLQFNVHPQSLV